MQNEIIASDKEIIQQFMFQNVSTITHSLTTIHATYDAATSANALSIASCHLIR
jgi:hypothetical protein